MAFFTSAVTGLKTVVTAIGAGVAVWGVINLLEGYGNDNPGAKSQGVKSFKDGVNEAKDEINKAKDEIDKPADSAK